MGAPRKGHRIAKKAIEEATKIIVNGVAPTSAKGTQTAAASLKLEGLKSSGAITSNFPPTIKEKKGQCTEGSGLDEHILKECLLEPKDLVNAHNEIVDRLAIGMSSASAD